ncbi:MAG TPA: hypothetical protein VLJ83_07735 [Gemmatimonadaceae bacterium]|nr:hypothetical protein [Gemmatimonadaceae bacterium]
MIANGNGSSRRELVIKAGQIVSAATLTTLITPAAAFAAVSRSQPSTSPGDWDLSWVTTLATATDRAVFDWPSLGDPADPQVLYFAERYLDNCKAAYAPGKYDARAVLNIRTQAIAAALSDATWERFALGKDYNVKDPVTQTEATRNPFWHRAPDPAPGVVLPTLADLLGRGAIILVCDFALGHLADRLAKKANRDAAKVHQELRSGFVPGAFAVPSGIFGLAKAQNAGCAYVRM